MPTDEHDPVQLMFAKVREQLSDIMDMVERDKARNEEDRQRGRQ